MQVVTGFDRPNLTWQVHRESDRLTALTYLIRQHRDQSGIVYCATRKTVEEVAAHLAKRGLSARPYHAGLGEEQRRQTQEDFIYDRIPVIVATNAFGMGINKPDVRYVIHYQMPASMEAYYRARQGQYRLYEMTGRHGNSMLPRVYTVDLREELKQGNRSMFSRKLRELLEGRLQAGEQTMLFLNRRGYAGFISCRACGHVMKCPHCDVSLSEHRGNMLLCHYCGHEEPKSAVCPVCGSKYLLGFKAGTQQIEEALHKEFPQARVLRMDADTTRTKESYEKILSAFADEKADILVGTQMIVKGHDFPNVTLVGILAADLSLNQNDYRAGERTFQLLTQAAGRAGRGQKPGEVVIQTYQPEHYSIVHAARQDYAGFYEEEIAYRELMQYPPAAHMLAVLVTSREQEQGTALCARLAGAVNALRQGKTYTGRTDNSPGQAASDAVGKMEQDADAEKWQLLQVIGPAEASIGRINDLYRHVFYMKHPDYQVLVEIKDNLEQLCKGEELKNQTVQYDFDPMNTY